LAGVQVEITKAAPDRLPTIAAGLGSAFAGEPMLLWSLGDHGDVERRFTLQFEYVVESKLPEEPTWHLDSIGVRPEARGQGIGGALIEAGLERARSAATPAILETRAIPGT
jgi:ribosomal protein S18 acetylase RimI-like enzyme